MLDRSATARRATGDRQAGAAPLRGGAAAPAGTRGSALVPRRAAVPDAGPAALGAAGERPRARGGARPGGAVARRAGQGPGVGVGVGSAPRRIGSPSLLRRPGPAVHRGTARGGGDRDDPDRGARGARPHRGVAGGAHRNAAGRRVDGDVAGCARNGDGPSHAGRATRARVASGAGAVGYLVVGGGDRAGPRVRRAEGGGGARASDDLLAEDTGSDANRSAAHLARRADRRAARYPLPTCAE